MALQGYLASIKGQSSATTLTNAPTTTTDNLTYTITNTSHRILDVNTPVVVSVDGTPVTTGFKVHLLDGKVVFDTAVVRTVTITGAFVALTELVQAKGYTLAISADMNDKTTFKKAFREFMPGLISGTATVSAFYIDNYFFDWLIDGTAKVVELKQSDTDIVRFFALINTDDKNIPVEGLQEQSISLTISKELNIYG